MVFVPSSARQQEAEEYISLCPKNRMIPDPDPADRIWQNTNVLKITAVHMDPHLPVIHMVRMKIHRKKSFLLLRIQLLKHITCRIRNSSAKSFKALVFHLRINVYHLILHTVIINKFYCFFILFLLPSPAES